MRSIRVCGSNLEGQTIGAICNDSLPCNSVATCKVGVCYSRAGSTLSECSSDFNCKDLSCKEKICTGQSHYGEPCTNYTDSQNLHFI